MPAIIPLPWFSCQYPLAKHVSSTSHATRTLGWCFPVFKGRAKFTPAVRVENTYAVGPRGAILSPAKAGFGFVGEVIPGLRSLLAHPGLLSVAAPRLIELLMAGLSL